MTRILIGAALVLLALMGLAVNDARRDAATLSKQVYAAAYTRDSLKARLAEAILKEAPARIDTVRQIVESVRTLRDSVLAFRTDTLLIERFVYRTDSLRVQCLACAALLDSIRVKYADENRATETYISMLRGEVSRAKRKRWQDRVAVGVGYGALRDGTMVRAGPVVAATIRVWPW